MFRTTSKRVQRWLAQPRSTQAASALARLMATLLIGSVVVVPSGVDAVGDAAGFGPGALQQAAESCGFVWTGPTTGVGDWNDPVNWLQVGIGPAGRAPAFDDVVCFGPIHGGTAVDGVTFDDLSIGTTGLQVDPTSTFTFSNSGFSAGTNARPTIGGVRLRNSALLLYRGGSITSGSTFGGLGGDQSSQVDVQGDIVIEDLSSLDATGLHLIGSLEFAEAFAPGPAVAAIDLGSFTYRAAIVNDGDVTAEAGSSTLLRDIAIVGSGSTAFADLSIENAVALHASSANRLVVQALPSNTLHLSGDLVVDTRADIAAPLVIEGAGLVDVGAELEIGARVTGRSEETRLASRSTTRLLPDAQLRFFDGAELDLGGTVTVVVDDGRLTNPEAVVEGTVSGFGNCLVVDTDAVGPEGNDLGPVADGARVRVIESFASIPSPGTVVAAQTPGEGLRWELEAATGGAPNGANTLDLVARPGSPNPTTCNPVDPVVTVTPTAVTVLEGDPVVLDIAVAPATPVVVAVAVVGGTGDSTDVIALAAASGPGPIVISTVEDDLPEGDETLTILVGGQPIDVTILEDDQAAAGFDLAGPGTTAEGATATFTLTLPAPAPQGMEVTWRFGNDPSTFDSPADASTIPASTVDVAPFTLLAESIPIGALSIDFDLPIEIDGDIEPAEAFTVTADVDGLLLDPVATAVIQADEPPTAGPAEQLLDGLDELPALLDAWATAFDLDESTWGTDPSDLPVVTDQLALLAGFDDDPATDQPAAAAARALPRPEPSDDLAQIVSALNDPNGNDVVGESDEGACTVEHAALGAGGVPVAPAGEIIRVRCERELVGDAGIVDDLWNDATPAVLDQLASGLGLDGTGSIDTDATMIVTFGVDANGFYLDPTATELRLDADADLTLTGTADAIGATGLDVTGAAVAEVTVRLLPSSGARLRESELADLAGRSPSETLRPEVTGTATTELSFATGPNEFDWSGDWSITTPPGEAPTVLVGTQRLSLRAELDGLSVGDVDTPDVLELEGVFAEGSWSLSGSMTQAALGGFRIVDASLDAVVDADGIQRLDATASLILDDRDPDVPVLADVELRTVGRDWSLDGTALFGSTALGPISATGVVVTVDLDSTDGAVGGQVTVSADSVEAFPDGPTALTGTDVTGQLFGDGSVRFTAATLAGDVADGAVTFTASDAEVRLGPSFDDDAALQLDEVELRFGALADTIVDATGLVVLADGRAGVETATIRNDAVGVFDSAGLGGILPFDVSEVSLAFDDEIPGTDPPVRSLDSFDVEVTGSFDQGALGLLPFIPRIGLGGSVVTPTSDPTDNVFTFSVAVESLSDGVIRPIDLGPVTLGIEDLELGDVALAAELTIDGWRDGELQPGVAGTFEIESGFDAVDTPADLSVTLSGRIVDGVLQLDATFALSATYAGIRLDDLSLDVRLEIGDVHGDVDGDGGFGATFTVVRTAIAGFEIPIGDLATVTGGDVEIVFDRQPGDPIIVVGGSPEAAVGTPDGGLGLRFDDLDALSGWTGRVGGFAVCDGGSVHLGPEAFAVVDPPADERFGLPAEVPLVVREAGLVLVTAADGDGPCEGPTVDDITDLRVRFSGGVEANETFPLSFELDGLEVGLARLTGLEPGFPITNLDGIRAGMSPQEIAPDVRIGGLIGFGTVPIEGDDVWYVQVEGLLGVGDLELGGTAVITEYGPVAISISSPVGVPLGPTGLVLASVSGGVRFNDPLPEIEDPMDLLGLDIAVGPGSIGLDEIAEAIEPVMTEGVAVWERPFTIAVTGHLTSIASPGLAGGDVSVGINVGFGDDGGLKLIGRGEIDAFGIDVGGGGMLIDFADPIAPRIDVAFAVPGPDAGPLALIMPSEGTMTMRIDTTGVADAALIGLRTFIEQVADGTLDLAADRFGVMLDDLAADLDDHRFRPLAQLLLDTDDNGVVDAAEGAEVIDREFLLDRLLALLPSDPTGAAALLERAPDLVNAVLGELIAAAEGLAVDPAELSADLLAAVGTARADLVALIEVVRTALVDAGVAALDVFAPSLRLEGSLQPLLLGIPFGEPEAGAALTIDRSGITVGFTVSINALLQRLANTIVPVVGGAIQSLLTLGATDRTTFDAQLPVGVFVESLITGTTLPTVDPDDGRWAISGQSRLGLFGTEMVAADVLITAPDNAGFIEDRVQLLFDPATGTPLDLSVVDIDPDRVPISTPEQLDALLEFGGILVAGRVEVPGMIVDPVSVIGGIDEPPEEFDAVESLAWLRQVVERITVPATPLRAVAFFPSPETIIVQQLDEFGDDRFSLDTAGPAAVARLERWLGAAFFEGVYDGLLLSMPIAKARVNASTDGIEVVGSIPLLGIDGRLTIGVREQTFADAVTLPVQTAELEVTIDALAEAGLLAQLGLPDAIGLEAGSVTARAVSPGFDIDSSDELERNGGIRVTARGDIDGLVDDAGFEVTVLPQLIGPAGLDVAVGVDRLGPVLGTEITDARLSFSSRLGSWSGALSGRLSILGVTATVDGSINIGVGDGFDARLRLGIAGGAKPNLGGLALDGRLDLVLSLDTSGVLVGLDLDTTTPFAGSTIDIDGTLRAGIPSGLSGSLSVGVPAGGLPLGGSTSPFVITGALSLTVEPGLVEFSATDAGLRWRSGARTIAEFVVDEFSLGTDASVSIEFDGFAFSDPSGFAFEVPSLDLEAGPGLANLRLVLGAGEVRIPGVADGSASRPALATPSITVDTTSDFRRVLAAGTLDLGLLDVAGRLVFEGTDGVFRLAIERLAQNRPATLTIAGLGTLRVDGTAFVASNGTFDIGVSADRLGPAALSLRNVSARMSKTTSSFSSLQFRLTGGQLALPLGDPVPLPDLSVTPFAMSGTQRFDETITLPSIGLGPALSISSARLRFRQLSDGSLRLEMTNPSTSRPTVRVLGGTQTLTLNRLVVTSTGEFDGSITGRLTLFGQRMASATFDLSRTTTPSGGSIARVTLPASRAASLNLGFVSADLFGSVASDGTFSFTSTLDIDVDILIASMTGSVDVTVANTGISGGFDGTACVFGVGCASVDGTMSSTGFVDATVGFDRNRNGIKESFFDVSFQIGTAPPNDSNRPSMTVPRDIVVEAQSFRNGRQIVNYTTPTATDDRDGAVPVTCSPASGSGFVVGDTLVTCRASDRAGNTRTRGFTITVLPPPPFDLGLTLAAGATTTVTGGRQFPVQSQVLVRLFSDPIELATVVARADGSVTWTGTIPADVPLGRHTLQLEGVDADDVVRFVSYDVEVVATSPAPQPGQPGVPTTQLPATGGGSPMPLVLGAAAFILFGAWLRRRATTGATEWV